MSLDAFSQAYEGTDWAKLAAVRPVAAAQAPAAAAVQAKAASNGGHKDGDAFLTFDDVIDIVNPLQHIPVVSSLYRHFTGDTQRPQGEILGGFLYGGLIGGAASVASVLFHEATGIDPGEEVIAFITGDEPVGSHPATTPNSNPTQIAAAAAATTAAAAAASSSSPGSSSPASVKPAAPGAAPATGPASASVLARRALVANNQAALQLLAQDLAGGGEVAGLNRVAQATPAPVPAPASPAPTTVAEALSATQSAGLNRPSRMPVRGAVATNPNPPPMIGREQQHMAAYTRPTPMAGMSPDRRQANAATAASGQAPAGAGLGPAAGAAIDQALAASTPAPARAHPRPSVVIPSGVANRAGGSGLGGGTAPLQNGPDGMVNPLQPAETAEAADLPKLDLVPTLMMRNLDKYQAMMRANNRAPQRPAIPG